MKTYKVAEVARLSRVTIRTLHYYDEIGLLVPSARTRAGYRLYREADLLRLQQILIHRELGFPLKAIKATLDAPDFELRRALLAQREELEKRQEDLSRMVAAVDAALSSIDVDAIEPKEIFGGFDPEAYAEEAKARWGESEAFRESDQRMRGYGPAELRAIKEEQDTLFRRMADILQRGNEPQSNEARRTAEAHRRYIDRWFYPCSRAAHARLAEMYVEDERFANTFNAYDPRLAEYFAAAIQANIAPE